MRIERTKVSAETANKIGGRVRRADIFCRIKSTSWTNPAIDVVTAFAMSICSSINGWIISSGFPIIFVLNSCESLARDSNSVVI